MPLAGYGRQIMKRSADLPLFSTLGLLLGLLLSRSAVWADDAAARSSAAGAPVCSLAIDGKLIEHLVLESRDGRHYAFDRPGGVVRLPPGEYRLQQLRLDRGCTWQRSGEAEPWFLLTPGRDQRLVAGAPLRPAVTATPGGGYLQLAYGLEDAAGRAYRGNPQSGQPHFTINKADKQVGSGNFKYG
jgi:hypothetical protein